MTAGHEEYAQWEADVMRELAAEEATVSASPRPNQVIDDVEVSYPYGGFETLGGMTTAKEYLRSALIAPMLKPELAAAFGIGAGAHLLLWGPPGCGKTLFARAAAAESGAALIAVNLADILGSYVGEDESNFARFFSVARDSAPCVIFFDEADSLAPKRNSPGMWEIERRLTNAFLQEVDGAKSRNEGVAVILASNQPWLLDPAMRRAGRMDEMLYIGLPDALAREAIWRMAFQIAPSVERLDFEELAGLSKGLTGAEIVEAARRALRAAFMHSAEYDEPVPPTQLDVLQALLDTEARSLDWFASADKTFCRENHPASRDFLAAGAFNAPNRRREWERALQACAVREAAEWWSE